MGEALLKVLLVDDEPFILQGLKILIDWEQEDLKLLRRRQTERKHWNICAGSR